MSALMSNVTGFLCLSLVIGCQRGENLSADLILVNGRILTVDSVDRVAQAVAIRGDKIIAVGTDAEIEAAATKTTRRIDLLGRAVTPGLLDAHSHFGNSGPRSAVLPRSALPGHSEHS